jgi:hypothetical protein
MADIWDDWQEAAEQQARVDAERAERERLAMAQLLVARGEPRAAALVAFAEYRTYCVDNWDGGQYQVILSIPPAQFDLVVGDVREALDAAAAAVVGRGQYAGLDIEVRLEDVAPGWDEALLAWLRDNHANTATEPLQLPGGAHAD